MLVRLIKTISYYAEIDTAGFGSDTEALESFVDNNVRYGIDAFMKAAPGDELEARVIFSIPEDAPVNRFSVNGKTGLLRLSHTSLPKGRGLPRAACDQPSTLEGRSRGSTQCFTSCHGSSP